MNYWLTTINMPWARRPAYNTARSIRVFIKCGYRSFMKEWIIFHAAYVSAKKKKVAEALGSLIKGLAGWKVNVLSYEHEHGNKKGSSLQAIFPHTSLLDGCHWSFFQIHAPLAPSCFLSCWIQSCWPVFLLAQISTVPVINTSTEKVWLHSSVDILAEDLEVDNF